MVIAITLVLLFLLFFFFRRHIGPTHLAVVAGFCIYQTAATDLAKLIHVVIPNMPVGLLQNILCLVLVLGFPILLYFRSYKGGLFGILRVVEALVLAGFITSLIAGPLVFFFNFDQLSIDIFNFIKSFETPILIIGVVAAYIDILFYRD